MIVRPQLAKAKLACTHHAHSVGNWDCRRECTVIFCHVDVDERENRTCTVQLSMYQNIDFESKVNNQNICWKHASGALCYLPLYYVVCRETNAIQLTVQNMSLFNN